MSRIKYRKYEQTYRARKKTSEIKYYNTGKWVCPVAEYVVQS